MAAASHSGPNLGLSGTTSERASPAAGSLEAWGWMKTLRSSKTRAREVMAGPVPVSGSEASNGCGCDCS